ncbi:MAG: amino acid ABC transporter permease [Rubrivivax sp.]
MTSAALSFTLIYLGKGALMTIALALGASLVSGFLGLVLALARLYGGWPLRLLVGAVVFVIRGVPLLILLVGVFVILPYLGVRMPSALVAVFTIGIYFAAYASEIYRAAILSIPLTQWDAGRSLGFTPWRVFSVVVFPQTVRFCAAPLIGIFIMTVKATSLVYAIGSWELLTAGKETAERTFQILPVYLGVAAIYFVVCFGLSRLARRVEKATTYG